MSISWASVEIDGRDAGPIQRLSIDERLDTPWSVDFEIEARDGNRWRNVDELIGAPASVSLDSESTRRFVGVVDELEERRGTLRVVLRPKVALLTSTCDHRLFLNESSLAIAALVLGEHGIKIDARVARALTTRVQCAQMFESDLDFVARLFADEGFSWFSAPDSDHVIVVDEPDGFRPIAGSVSLPFHDDSALAADESFFEGRVEERLVADAVRLRDYNHERPAVDQNVEQRSGSAAIPIFEVPGGYDDPGVGNVIARRRLEEAQTASIVFRGRAASTRLSAGAVFELELAPSHELNRRWLVVEARLEGVDGSRLRAGERALTVDVVAFPADRPRRPRRPPAPRLNGLQTATITGPRGSEINTDELGRVTALLRWDRRGPSNDKSSRWIRALQPQTTGAMFLPRVGWEALVAFGGGSGDEPYVLGRLDHGAALPAEHLPRQKVRSAFGTPTTPGGGSKNVFRLDDAAGNEGMLLGASKDHNELTAADKVVSVAADDTHSVGAERKIGVGAALQVNIAGAQNVTIAGFRELGIGASRHLQLASHSTSIGAARTWKIGGDLVTSSSSMTRIVGGAKLEVAIDAHHRHVSGNSVVLAGGGLTEQGGLGVMTGVLGNHLRVSGPIGISTPLYALKVSSLSEHFGSHTINCAGAIELKPSASGKVNVKGTATFKGASGVVVSADSKVTIEAGGATITITPSSVTLKGPFKEGENVKILGKLEIK